MTIAGMLEFNERTIIGVYFTSGSDGHTVGQCGINKIEVRRVAASGGHVPWFLVYHNDVEFAALNSALMEEVRFAPAPE